MIKDYAFINNENKIVNVIIIDDSESLELFNILAEQNNAVAWYDLESYGNAGVGGFYDQNKNKLFPASPYPSWIWSDDQEKWVAPKPYPNHKKAFDWDESILDWVEFPELGLI